MNDHSIQERMDLLSFIPSDWFLEPEKSTVWIAAFRSTKLTSEDFPTGIKSIDLEKAKVLLLYGEISFLDDRESVWEIAPNSSLTCTFSAKESKTPLGAWLVFIIPYRIDGKEENERDIRFKLSSLTGLFSGVMGRSIVFEKFFENIIHLKDKKTNVTGPSVLNPLALPKPIISNNRFELIKTVLLEISSQPESIKNKFFLSLHWYEQSEFSVGTDSLLKIWIALEVLGMEETASVKPLNETIATGYGITIKEVRNKFFIGRIQNLRSKIVHDGKRVPIHFLLLDYIRAIYLDILLIKLDIPCEKRAERILDDPQFNLRKFLH